MAIGLSFFYFEAIRILPVIPYCVDNNFFFSNFVINNIMAGN